tara:strand:+ start:623 stop:1012 length:390 start_codon:yes stop_codon:yes gene_type:complete
MTYKFPKDYLYADTHEYVKKENEFFKIGISEFAVDQLGDIVFVELTEKGSILQKGETFGTIESVKAVEEVYLPFSAEIIETNSDVIDNPEILQNDPIGEGWLLIIKPIEDVSFDNLINSDEYKSKVAPN